MCSLPILGSTIGGSLVESLMRPLHLGLDEKLDFIQDLFMSWSPIYILGVKPYCPLAELNQVGLR